MSEAASGPTGRQLDGRFRESAIARLVDCQAACLAFESCEAIVVVRDDAHFSSDEERRESRVCYRRAAVELAKCQPSTKYDVLVLAPKPPLPPLVPSPPLAPPPPYTTPVTTAESINAKFQEHGWLVHMFFVSAHYQQVATSDPWYPHRRWVDRVCDAADLGSIPGDPDCGPDCMGFSYMPPRGPILKYSLPNWRLGAGIILSATPEMWSHVQCAAVVDSNSVHRVACGTQCTSPSDKCKQLKAGCGAHDAKRWSKGNDGCSEPYWCSSPFWFQPPITSARSWMTRGGKSFADVCKFKSSERAVFEQSLHDYSRQLKRGGNVWETEVNLYVGEHSGTDSTLRTMVNNIEALMFDKTLGVSEDLDTLRKLQRHLRRMGKVVPIVEISTEYPQTLKKWDSERSSAIDLTDPPYSMRVVEQ